MDHKTADYRKLELGALEAIEILTARIDELEAALALMNEKYSKTNIFLRLLQFKLRIKERLNK